MISIQCYYQVSKFQNKEKHFSGKSDLIPFSHLRLKISDEQF